MTAIKFEKNNILFNELKPDETYFKDMPDHSGKRTTYE